MATLWLLAMFGFTPPLADGTVCAPLPMSILIACPGALAGRTAAPADPCRARRCPLLGISDDPDPVGQAPDASRRTQPRPDTASHGVRR